MIAFDDERLDAYVMGGGEIRMATDCDNKLDVKEGAFVVKGEVLNSWVAAPGRRMCLAKEPKLGQGMGDKCHYGLAFESNGDVQAIDDVVGVTRRRTVGH